MKTKTIIRAIVLAAVIAVISIVVIKPQGDSPAIDIRMQPTQTLFPPINLTVVDATSSPQITVSPPETPKKETTPVPTKLKQNDDALFTLTIRGKKVEVAHGVDEGTLKKTPGWLPTSVMPGEDGACVVYGHRNRAHLRILKDVAIGDAIFVTMQDGVNYKYCVSDIKIFENTTGFILPVVEGKALVLATCYPFRYNGNAPGKCVVTALMTSGVN